MGLGSDSTPPDSLDGEGNVEVGIEDGNAIDSRARGVEGSGGTPEAFYAYFD